MAVEGQARLRLSWSLDPSSLSLEHRAGARAVRAPGFGLRPAGGGLEVPFRVEFVAIPEGVTPRLEILSTSPGKPLRIEDLPSRSPVGSPASASPGALPGVGGGVAGSVSAGTAPALPGPSPALAEGPVALGQIGYFRAQRFVEVRVSPVLPSTDGGAVTVYEALEAALTWEEIATEAEASEDTFLEPMYSRLFVNADQGRSFRVPRRGRGPKAGAQGPTGAQSGKTLLSTSASSPVTASTSAPSLLGATTTATTDSALIATPAPSLRMEVTRAGIVRLTQAQLAAAAPDLARLDPHTFRLTYRGAELPVFVAGEADGVFDAGDYIEFYGIPPADAPLEKIAEPPATFVTIWQLRDFTDTNVYWLDSAAGTRQRVATLDAAPTHGFPLAADWASLARSENSGLFRPFGGNDPWVSCPRLADRNSSCSGSICCDAPGFDFPLGLPGLASGPGDAFVRLVLQGWSPGSHRADVKLNGSLLSTTSIEWTGLGAVERRYPVSNSSLTAASAVNVTLPGNAVGDVDSVVVDFVEVGYRRRFTAGGGGVVFATPDANQTFDVDGFTTQPVAWYDVSQVDPSTGHPVARRLSGASVSGVSGAFRTRFELAAEGLPASQPRQVVVAAPEAVNAPAAVRRVQQEPLCDPSIGADLIVIGHPDLIDLTTDPALQDYLQYRQLQGLRTRVVNVLDVFDQFSGGLPDVRAIRDFLACAYSTWVAPPPSFVMFLGDGTSDYKNQRSSAAWRNQIPAPIHTIEDAVFGYYSADTWYATFRGADFVPDILYGRISAGTLPEAENALRKILRYEQPPQPGDWRARGLFVAGDGNDVTQDEFFAKENDAAAAGFVAPFSAQKLYYGDPLSYNGTKTSEFRTDLQAALNQGAAVVNYVGHGNFTIWDGDQIFKNSDVADLTNTDRLPVFFNSTCLMGGYHLDTLEALGEVLIESTPDTGGIAVFAPSGLSYLNIDAQVIDILYSGMMGPQRLRTLGEITTAVRVALAQQGSVVDMQNLTLLGDPLLHLTLPAPKPASGLGATPGNLRVDLTWSPSPDPEPVTGYHVYRTQASNPAVGSGAVYTRVTAAPVAGGTFADTQVKNTVTYAYAVTAVDAGGFESAYSNLNTTCGVSSADCVRATPYNPSPPAAPRGLSASDPGIGFRVDLQWLANSEPDLKTYTVLWGSATGDYSHRQAVGLVTRASVYVDSNNVGYYFAVTATNTSDGFTPPGSTTPLRNESAPSAEVSAVATLIQGIRPPAMIRDLRIERDADDPPSVRLSWTKPLVDIYGGPTTVTGFQVHRSEAVDFRPTTATLRATLTADVSSWPDPAAYADSRSFYYLVLASDGAGRLSSASRAFPTGINDLRLVEEKDTVTGLPTGFLVLSWGAVSRDIEGLPTVVDHYEVYGNSSPFTRDQLLSNPLLASVSGLSTKVLAPTTRFFYSIVAVDRRGNRSPF